MNKFVVLGSQGSGKSYIARQIGQRLDIPVYHLDEVFWNTWGPPLNISPTEQEINQKMDSLIRKNAWVIDGNFVNTLLLRLTACDIVVYLATPRLLCLWRVLRRGLSSGLAKDAPPYEKFNLQLARHIWRFPLGNGQKLLNLVYSQQPPYGVRILESKRQINRFLSEGLDEHL